MKKADKWIWADPWKELLIELIYCWLNQDGIQIADQGWEAQNNYVEDIFDEKIDTETKAMHVFFKMV